MYKNIINNVFLEFSGIFKIDELADPLNKNYYFKVWNHHYNKILSMSSGYQNARILEIGIGFGILSTLLSKLGAKVTATEHPSRNYLNNDKYLQKMASNNITIAMNNLYENLPFKPETFDKVFFCDVIEHLYPWKIKGVLAEIKRVLKPGGEIIVSTPNLRRFSNILRFLTGRGINPKIDVAMADETFDHIREYNFKELGDLLIESGFLLKNVEFGENSFFDLTENKKIRKLNKIFTTLFFKVSKNFGDEIYLRGINDLP